MKRLLLVLLLGTLAAGELVAEDGYRLWLRYDRFLWKKVRESFSDHLQTVVLQTPSGVNSEVLAAAEAELIRGMAGMIHHEPRVYVVAGEASADLRVDGFAVNKVTVDGRVGVR
ncbi:MAG: hypothetical protein ACKVI3_13040, partial [Verrucomicrobiia bacterium]